MAKTYFVGWVSMAARTSYLRPPAAPSNYKDPDKIEAYKQEQLSKLMAEASSTPVVGTLASVAVEEARPGGLAFQHASSVVGNVSAALVDWLLREDVEIAVLYGFDAEILLEMAALEVLAEGSRELHYSSWHESSYIKDPYKMLLRGETRKIVGLPQLVKFLTNQDFDPAVFRDPREQIKLAKTLVEAGQLPGCQRHVRA